MDALRALTCGSCAHLPQACHATNIAFRIATGTKARRGGVQHGRAMDLNRYLGITDQRISDHLIGVQGPEAVLREEKSLSALVAQQDRAPDS